MSDPVLLSERSLRTPFGTPSREIRLYALEIQIEVALVLPELY